MRTDAPPAMSDLILAQTRVNRADEEARRAREARDELLARMRDEGVPYADLQAATGLSRKGLWKLINQ